jgi:thiamine biosynthesis lipoprotein
MTLTRGPRNRDRFAYTRPAGLPMPGLMGGEATTPTVVRPGAQVVRSLRLLGGTVHVDLRGVHDRAGAERALDSADAWLHRVNTVFGSAQDTALSLLRRDKRVSEVDEPLVEDVLVQCERAWSATDGWFDPWELAGGFDPSGLLHGWALGPTADLLSAVAAGLRIDSGGDVLVRGERAPGLPWAVGIRRPDAHTDLTAILDVTDIAVSTSAGRGVVDPGTRRPGRRLRSATVVGPDAASTDAFATALVASGPHGLQWLSAQRGYEAYLVDLDGSVHSTSGLPRRAG